ncbi:MAG: DUF262 domain-containing protein [Flavobacteriales bacterium]|nr:DUF262 domain-containing protein [Flavobacteriales bacterium]
MEASTIKELFGRRNVRFEIPSYQRAYAWGKQQLTQFLEDLKDCAGRDYYLGHFLFEQDEDTLYVIDGQQRLTTCVIFFSVILEILESRKEEWKEIDGKEKIQDLLGDISDYYIKEARRQKQKFATVAYDNNFFVDMVIERKNNYSKEELTSASQIAINEALIFFKRKLQKKPIEDILLFISSLENAAITTFVVKDKTQACQIFAYQNDRGKKLSNLEVLKVYFVLHIYRGLYDEKECEDCISYIEKAFEEIYRYIVLISINEDAVLRYYWQAFSPRGYNSGDVINEVKEWIDELSQEKVVDEIKQFVANLSKAFHLVEYIEKDNSFYTANLKLLDNMAMSYPILIKAKLANVEDEVFKRLIKLMENVTFRVLLVGSRAKIYDRLMSAFWYGSEGYSNNYSRMIRAVITSIKSGHDWWGAYWGDFAVERKLKEENFYYNRVKNYVLWRYEQYLCNDCYPIPKLLYSDVMSGASIEHIFPKSISYYNIVNYDGCYGKLVDHYNEWTNKLGNLVLMAKSQNSSLGNKDFAHKLSVYGSDNLLHQQKEIIEFVDDKEKPIWDSTCINKRTEKIIEAAKEIWDLDRI